MKTILRLLALVAGVYVGFRFPDIDQRTDLLVHRSIITHGLLAPLLLYAVLGSRRSPAPARLFVAGVALAVAANEPADWWLSRPTERVTKKMGQMLTPVGRALLSWHDENQRVAWDAAVPARFEELRDGGLAAGEALLRTLGLPPCQLPALKLPPDPHPGPLGYDELGLARLLS